MDFTLTEAQRDLAGLAGRILGDWAKKNETQAGDQTALDRELWTSLARAGLLDAALPSAVGGGGFGVLERCSVLIEIGRTAAPVPYLSSIAAVAASVAEHGTGQQAERWVVPVVRGDRLVAAALADTGTSPGFTAERTADGWRLQGAQTAVLHGASADGFLCEASTEEGDALFLVERDAAGVSVTAQHVVDGHDAALLELTDVVLSAGALLGTPGAGAPEWTRNQTLVALCAQQLGTLERALELTAEYAREREQFGAPIGSFQAVRQRLADAYLDVEAVRLTLWQAAWRLSEGLPATEEVATAKFWAAEAGHRVAHTCVHVHGGVGIDVDYPMHRYFVAAKRCEFALGGATAQLRALGAALAEDPA